MRGGARQQIEALKDEAELAIAQTAPAACGSVRQRPRHPADSVPLVGRSRQPRMFISVDLPEPLAPMMATNSPLAMDSETPHTACTRLRRSGKSYGRRPEKSPAARRFQVDCSLWRRAVGCAARAAADKAAVTSASPSRNPSRISVSTPSSTPTFTLTILSRGFSGVPDGR